MKGGVAKLISPSRTKLKHPPPRQVPQITLGEPQNSGSDGDLNSGESVHESKFPPDFKQGKRMSMAPNRYES